MKNKLCECGCGKEVKNKNRFVHGHNSKFIKKNMPSGEKHHAWKGGKIRAGCKQYPAIKTLKHPRSHKNGVYVFEHILRAEKALGNYLPPKAVIHHHSPEQLVICQDQAYHLYLHQRQRAFYGCGNPNWRRCSICKRWDAPKNLYIPPNNTSARHRKCHANREYNRRQSNDKN